MTSAQRVLLLIAVLVAILIGHLLTQSSIQEAQTQSRQSEDTPSFSTPIEEEDFASDRILVKPKQGVSDEAVERLNQENDASTEEKLPRAKVSVVELPEELPVEEAVERYEDSPDIEYAEPDFILKPSQTTTSANDPNYSKLYGLNNTGQTGGTSGADIDAPEAWSTTTGSTSTVVAVIDTGTDIKHPDLKNNIWTNPGETAGNGIDDDRNGYVDDVNGWDFANNDASVFDSASEDSHGTHVAGTIAAEGNNSLGVVGVNWKAKIMPLKFLGGANGGYTSNAVKAIDYAIAKGAKISNNSWGGGGYSQALLDAINRADTAGHLFVAAAGNGGSDGVGDDNDATDYYPSGYNSSNIISVGATDSKDSLASFSNYGSTSIDLAAPGVSILSTLPGDTYGSYNGTSMATPHVAGTAALLKSKNTSADDATLKTEILKAVDAKPNLSGKTASGGRTNASKTLGVKSTELSLDANPLTIDYGGGTSLSGRLTSSGQPLSGKKVILEQRPVSTSAFSPVSGGERTTDTNGNFSLAGVKPSKNTDYQARFAAESSSGLPAATSTTRRVDVKALVSLSTSTKNLRLGRSRTISGAISPAHSGSVTLTIKRDGAVLDSKTLTLSSSKYSFTYKPPSVGTYSFSASFGSDTDHLGNTSVERSFRVVR